jgi:hypothetical protein
MSMAKGQSTRGDIRLDRRREVIMNGIVTRHSLVEHKAGGGRAGEVAMLNYLASPKTGIKDIMAPDVGLTAKAARGRRVVAAQDTTEVNFAGRDKRRKGLGPGGDGETPGFFIHAVVAIDADDEAVIGPVSVHIWTREPGKVTPRRGRAFEDRESARWLTGARSAAGVLDEAAQIVVVGDRESDIYPLFARVPEGVDFVVRAAQDRTLVPGCPTASLLEDREDGTLFGAAAAWPELGGQIVKVAPKGIGDKGRMAHVIVKAGTVTIRRPAYRNTADDSETLTLTLVEAVETGAPEGAKALKWRLITTLPAATLEEAMEVVRLYRLRWRIEQVFRTLKKDGLDLEATQIEAAERIMKLAAFAVVASCRIIQLVDARDGGPRPATDAIRPDQVEDVAAISASLEGRTERQKNPWVKGALSWLAWVVARLGGWTCYYKPPGPKTMADGWRRLEAMLAGCAIARGPQHV